MKMRKTHRHRQTHTDTHRHTDTDTDTDTDTHTHMLKQRPSMIPTSLEKLCSPPAIILISTHLVVTPFGRC